MSFFQSQQPIIIPDPVQDTKPGPSANNVPIPSSSPGTLVTNTINNATQATYYNVAADLLPQDPLNPTRVYRFTFNGVFSAGSTAGTGGNLDVFCALYTPASGQNLYMAGASVFASATIPITQGDYSFSAIFIPQVGDSIKIIVANNTGGTLTGASLFPSSKGCGIELVSTQSAPVLIFS